MKGLLVMGPHVGTCRGAKVSGIICEVMWLG